ncbi:MAG: energy-coupling factor transporter ATPase [Nitrospiraceae bacterium]|nr:energy-coupling factor transporter ATPase [Nitrospiraceae bacterium]
MIRFENVYFSYEKENWAVEDLGFTIENGEFVALAGSNGSGKSTIARLTDGLFLPQKGRVLVDGLNSKENAALLKSKVGLVFQNPDDQFVGTTVEEDIAFGLENLAVPRGEAKARIKKIINILNIKQYLHSSPAMLSGGEKQKVAIAGVLVMQPDYLVLDEITALLDPLSRKEILNLVYSIAKKNNIGVLYITHIIDEALLADKVILISEGKKVKEGIPSEVFNDKKFLNSIGVAVPIPVYISSELSKKGLVENIVTSEEELLNEICLS